MTADNPTQPDLITAETYMSTLTIEIPLSVLGMLSGEVIRTGQPPGVIIANALRATLGPSPAPREGTMPDTEVYTIEKLIAYDWVQAEPPYGGHASTNTKAEGLALLATLKAHNPKFHYRLVAILATI